jgi:hypothetical protein
LAIAKLSYEERQVLNTLLARRDNYDVTSVKHLIGKCYEVVVKGQRHRAVVLFHSFEFYLKRYHLADIQPTFCVCMVHNTVLPVGCLSLQSSNLAEPYDLPEGYKDLREQRKGKHGSQVLLGMYLLGMRNAQDIIFAKDFPETTRKRYLRKAKALQRRLTGMPVGHEPKEKSEETKP